MNLIYVKQLGWWAIDTCNNLNDELDDTCNNLDNSPGNYAEWEKPIPKDYILHDSIYVTFLNWQHFRNGGQNSNCQVLEVGQKV